MDEDAAMTVSPSRRRSFELTSEMRLAAEEQALKHKVSGALSEYDYLLGYTIKHVELEPAEAVDNYFLCGKEDAARIAFLIEKYEKLGDGKRVADFAAGFGRVTRFLTSWLPSNELTAIDVHDEACSFIDTNLKVKAIRSCLDPNDFECPPQDFIFALSLFSHLPDKTFGRWMSALYRSLEPDGILLFTTHGEAARRHDTTFFDKNYDGVAGFGFRPESDQENLPSSAYGTMVVDVAYVLRQLREHAPGALIESYRSKSWFGLQDEWIIRRPATG